MAEIRVVWSHLAKIQRDDIFNYWNTRNKSTHFSKKLKIKIKEKTEQLKIQPNSGLKIKGTDKKILFFGNYSLIYKVLQNEIRVYMFWENHQNPEKLKSILGL